MLPAISPEVLSANPRFDVLYRDLCTNRLEPDGSTKLDAKASKERQNFSDELRKVRFAAAKRDLIVGYLEMVGGRGDDLPSEVQELVAVIAAALQGVLGKDDVGLLRGAVERFKENIQLIALVVSHAAAQDITSLARLVSPSAGNDWRSIPTSISLTKEKFSSSHMDLHAHRITLLHETLALHALYRNILETSIRILEQIIHGAISRHTKAKADYLATVAEGIAKKLGIQQRQVENAMRTPEMQELLRTKEEGLEREVLGLKGRLREAREMLEDYKEAKVMQGLAEEYAEIRGAIEKVRADVERLKG